LLPRLNKVDDLDEESDGFELPNKELEVCPNKLVLFEELSNKPVATGFF